MPLRKEMLDATGHLEVYGGSWPLILERAHQGDSTAQSIAGYCYLTGVGVKKSPIRARRWLIEAALNGDVDAMSNLGLMFETGDGTSANRRQALRWYRMAALSGDTFAQVNLALMYLGGGRPNRVLGIEWLRRAARKGDPKAMFNLGAAYLRGDGVKASLKTGERCLRKAAELGDKNAIDYLNEP